MNTYTKANPPPVGTLINVDLILISRCCGSTLVGYSAGYDDTYLFLSSKPSGGPEAQIGWNAVTGIQETFRGEICIDL